MVIVFVGFVCFEIIGYGGVFCEDEWGVGLV